MAGDVTFAFTDIEGSTARWERDRVAMQDAVRRHDANVQMAIVQGGGQVFKTAALMRSEQERYAEAEALHLRAIAIREKSLGPDRPDVAQSLNNLGKLYCLQQRYAEAEPLFERALSIRERSLGSDHPWTKEARDSLEALRHAK
jgi:tetratricopeptide (TPR) repeat protein